MVFGRGRKAKQEQLTDPGETQEAVADASADGAAAPGSAGATSAVAGRGATGPFDVSEIKDQDGYVDLGALLIAPAEGLQLQAFAAPRSEGLWDEIREQIGQSVGSQGGQIEEIQGGFGTELLAKLPAGGADASHGYRVARFIGVDGPRWFLRGVFGGEAAVDREAAAGLESLFRQIVVVRGENPMPPRDLLQLRLPKDNAVPAPQSAPDLERPERGPEITQIG